MPLKKFTLNFARRSSNLNFSSIYTDQMSGAFTKVRRRPLYETSKPQAPPTPGPLSVLRIAGIARLRGICPVSHLSWREVACEFPIGWPLTERRFPFCDYGVLHQVVGERRDAASDQFSCC